MNDTLITFCGWVGSDVTLSDIGHDTLVATFRVGSTPRRLRSGQWEDAPTAWYTVKAWRALAQHVHESVRQGDPVLVQGRLVADVWERTDGTRSTRYVVVATAVGHDLNRGRSVFTKATRRESSGGLNESLAQEVIHSYDESGPKLDADGEVVPELRRVPEEEPAA